METMKRHASWRAKHLVTTPQGVGDWSITPRHGMLPFAERQLFELDELQNVRAGRLMAWAAATAVVAVVILLLLNRRAGYVVLAGVVIIGVGIWIAIALRGPQPPTKDGLSAHASVDAELCSDPAKPIAIEFHNGNNRPIERSSFSLVAKPTGHSTVAYRAFLRDDKIIAPGQSTVTCFGLLPHGFTPPRPTSINLHDYDWSVEVSLVTFTNL